MSAPVGAVLRDLSEADLPWVAEREHEIFGPAAWSLQVLRDDFAYGLKRYRGVELDGELVGYAIFGFDGDAFSLMNIAIVPHARRRGLARLFMDDLLDDARRLRVPEAWLEVAVTNTGALALYREYGFEDVRIRPRYYQPEDVDGLVMRRRMREADGADAP